MIPGLYNGRDKTFFMVSWESLRSDAGQTQLQLVPTQAMLQGNFSGATNAAGAPINIIDPLTKQPFPNNQIPANRLNPVALNLVKYYPVPNLNDSLYNYAAQATATDSYDNFSVKIDQSLGATTASRAACSTGPTTRAIRSATRGSCRTSAPATPRSSS